MLKLNMWQQYLSIRGVSQESLTILDAVGTECLCPARRMLLVQRVADIITARSLGAGDVSLSRGVEEGRRLAAAGSGGAGAALRSDTSQSLTTSIRRTKTAAAATPRHLAHAGEISQHHSWVELADECQMFEDH